MELTDFEKPEKFLELLISEGFELETVKINSDTVKYSFQLHGVGVGRITLGEIYDLPGYDDNSYRGYNLTFTTPSGKMSMERRKVEDYSVEVIYDFFKEKIFN